MPFASVTNICWVSRQHVSIFFFYIAIWDRILTTTETHAQQVHSFWRAAQAQVSGFWLLACYPPAQNWAVCGMTWGRDMTWGKLELHFSDPHPLPTPNSAVCSITWGLWCVHCKSSLPWGMLESHSSPEIQVSQGKERSTDQRAHWTWFTARTLVCALSPQYDSSSPCGLESHKCKCFPKGRQMYTAFCDQKYIQTLWIWGVCYREDKSECTRLPVCDRRDVCLLS